jgi:hypothetical protein
MDSPVKPGNDNRVEPPFLLCAPYGLATLREAFFLFGCGSAALWSSAAGVIFFACA